MPSVRVITHGDLDGWVSGVLIRDFFTVKHSDIQFKIEYVGYRNVDHAVDVALSKSPDWLFITDISPVENHMLDKLNDRAQTEHVVLIDHHKTVKEKLMPFSWAVFNDAFSASLIVHAHFIEQGHYFLPELTHLAKLADVWDMWRLEDPLRNEAVSLNRLYHFLGYQYMDRIFPARGAISSDVLMKVLEQDENRFIERWIKNLKREEIQVDTQGRGYFFIISDQYISTLANEICNEFDIDYVMVYIPSQDILSLRSVGDRCDVSEIAKKYGGGGHKNAAGIQLGRRLFSEYNVCFHP